MITPTNVDDASRRTTSDGAHHADQEFVGDVLALYAELMRRACALTAQRADAEDLLQDTLLKAFQSCGTFVPGTNLRAWLHRILRNTYLDTHRLAGRRPVEHLTADLGSTVTVRCSVESAEDRVMDALPDIASRALHLLPADLREALLYADVHGFRNTEIAALLSIPVGTVGSRLHRGRERLRRAVTAQAC